MSLVEARDLQLPGRLEPLSLRLNAGELVCLVGPNGSGKTSLLHALAGIGGAWGEVLIDGSRVADAGPEQRLGLLSYLPATRDVAWPLRAEDLVRLGCPPGDAGARVTSIFEELGIGSLKGRRMDRLSTGERSRVLIARALVAQPKLLLLDEPAANLDPLWQLKLMEHVRAAVRTSRQAALVAVHDLELARDHADRLIIMSGGKVAADGDPETLLSGPDIPQIFGIARVNGRWRPVA